MATKNLKKQLIVAIIALFMVIIGLTSATFAWFVMQTQVEAQGMNVDVKTEGLTFEITNTYDTDDKAVFTNGTTHLSVTIDSDAQKALIPIHPQDVQSLTDAGNLADVAAWYHAYSSSYSDADIEEGGKNWTNVNSSTDIYTKGFGYLTNADDSTTGPFALVVPFTVRLNPEGGQGVHLEDIKATDLQISDSTVTDANGNKLSNCVCLVVAGPNGCYRISTAENTQSEQYTNYPAESGVLINKLTPTAGDEQQIVVYAYFDGRDKDCKSEIFDASNLSISLSFTGTEVKD